MLPNFLIIGAQKSGTTSLRYYLEEHPEIYMHPKEIHFFDDRNGAFNRGVGYYRSFFENLSGARIVGECTPCYMFPEEAPQRIHAVIPDVRLAIIMRNPVDRAYSHYWKNIKNGREKYSFEEAIEREAARMEKSQWHRLQFSYVARGFYSDQLMRFLTHFSLKDILVLIFEEFTKSPQECLRKVYSFLGIDLGFVCSRIHEVKNQAAMSRSKWLFSVSKKQYPFPGIMSSVIYETRVFGILKAINKKFNVKPFAYPEMEADTRKMLLDRYSASTEKLSNVIGRDLSFWNE
jgi:hypothetical protein